MCLVGGVTAILWLEGAETEGDKPRSLRPDEGGVGNFLCPGVDTDLTMLCFPGDGCREACVRGGVVCFRGALDDLIGGVAIGEV